MSNSANICQTFQPSSFQNKSNFDVILFSPWWKLFVWCGQICIFNYAKNDLLHNLCSDYFIKNIFQPHSLLGSGSRHRLSVGSGSGKSLKQSISSPAISDIIKSKVGGRHQTPEMGYGIIMRLCVQGPPSSKSVDNFRQLPPPITPEILSPTQARSRDLSQMKRRVKSPDLHETTFTMSTIEEEIESVNPVAFHT